jgi:3-deoxy-7-phosphoheptulonate synthase
MLLRLRKPKDVADLKSVQALAKRVGYEVRTLDQDGTLVELSAPVDGSPRHPHPEDRSRFEDLACVVAVLDSAEAPELHARAPGREETVVQVGDARFGGGNVSLIAGPCAVEEEPALLEIARAVRAAGATLLRGGAYKPRTSPYSFQGLGEVGLERLARVKQEVGIGVVTEVLDPRDVEQVCRVADMLQVGARSMANFALLTEVGRSGKPVLLKRGLAAKARELLLAAEYVLAAGNPDVVLCERGIRGFDSVTRNVLDLGTVAHLKGATHLPVIVDPSHAAGRPDLVPALSRAGIAVGADGLIIEVHPRPTSVHSDGAQAVSPEVFGRIAADVRELVALDRKTLALPRTAGRARAVIAEQMQ